MLLPRFNLFLLAAVVMSACAWGKVCQAQTLTPRQRGNLAIEARAILMKYCAACHSGDSSRVNVSQHSSLLSSKAPVPFVSRDAKAEYRSQVLELIDSGTMPPGGKPRPSAEEQATLQRWIQAMSPSYPAAFDDATTLQRVLENQATLDPTAKQYTRYISLGHLVDKPIASKLISEAARQLQSAWLLVAKPSALNPEPIDDTATLFRFDLRSTGWHTSPLPGSHLFEQMTQDAPSGAVGLGAFDLVLLEYPFTVPIPASLNESWAAMVKAIKPSELVPPVPFLRGDWLGQALLNQEGEPTALGQELLSLAELGEALAKDAPRPVGPKFAPFSGPEKLVSHGGGWGSWYAQNISLAEPPFKLAVQAIDTSSEQLKAIPLEIPYKLKVTADADLTLQVFKVDGDGLVQSVSIPVPNQVYRDKPKLIYPADTGNPAFVHVGLPKDRERLPLWYVVYASDKPLSPPTLVRSRHTKNPIWRIIPAIPGDAKTIRQVLPLEIVGNP